MFKKILQAVVLLTAVVASGLAAAAPVGYVHAVKGTVTLRDAGKQPVQAKVGDMFEQGANFTTGANGEVTMKFEDGQIAMLSPNTVFIATTYQYNKNKVADGNIVFNLLRGGLRFVSGVMAETNPAKFAVRTPTATAGVRGSAGTIIVSQDGQQVTAMTNKGIVTLTVTPPGGGAPTTVVLPVGFFVSTQAGQLLQATPTSALLNAPPGSALAGVALLVQVLGAATAPPNNPISVLATANAISLAVRAAADPGNAALQAEANAALVAAIAANQEAIAAAIAGGAAAGAGTDTGGAAVDVLAPAPPSAPPVQPAPASV